MKYTVSHNGAICTLPTFTRGIKKRIDEVNKQISDTEIPLDSRVESMHEFLKEAVGEDALTKALGSEDLDDIDLNDINILYLKITNEYDQPVKDYNKKELIDPETRKALQEVEKVTKNFTTISKITGGTK